MNRFATLIEFKRYKKVTYYTIQLCDGKGGKVDTETDQFFEFCLTLTKNKNAQRLIAWIEVIGNDYGAKEDLFRWERLAVALPPDIEKIANGTYKKLFVRKLRLYAFRVSDSVVILFNGGIKTNRDPELCPNVGKHFRNSQKFVSELKTIGIRHSFCSIDNIDDLFFMVDIE